MPVCVFRDDKGYKVLLADIDPQGNATSGLGINKRALEQSAYDVMINSCLLYTSRCV